MNTRHQTKLVHEGQYVAEVEVNLIDTDDGWSPYLSLDDAYKLDDVREALRRGDLAKAGQKAKRLKGKTSSPLYLFIFLPILLFTFSLRSYRL